MTAHQSAAASKAGPLSFPVFRALWIATIVSNIGTWMHDVGAGWLMTSLSPSPLLVALVQAATTLPMFLLSLPAGALADTVDRRRMLLAGQTLGLVAAAVLAGLTWQDLTTPHVLLAATLVLGISAALTAPVFQAIVPELVDQPTLPDAVALNSLGINIARAIGPALGGVIVAVAGTAAVFALNALSVIAVLVVLVRWKRPADSHALPPEHFVGALKAGYRYARHAPALRLVLVRAVGFFVFSSALWAMLPLVARRGLGSTQPDMAPCSAAWVPERLSGHCCSRSCAGMFLPTRSPSARRCSSLWPPCCWRSRRTPGRRAPSWRLPALHGSPC